MEDGKQEEGGKYDRDRSLRKTVTESFETN